MHRRYYSWNRICGNFIFK